MIKRVFILIVIVLIALFFVHTFGVNSHVQVLFLGNSLTFTNNLPGMIAQLAKSRHIDMQYDIYAPGEYRLMQHASDPNSIAKINEKKWDFVVLQDQGQMPAFSDEQVRRDVFANAKILCDAVKKADPDGQVVFYETMARKSGDPGNVGISQDLATYDGMQKRIDRSYVQMSTDNWALLAPVGQAWKEVRDSRPDMELYLDEMHPNLSGSYLAACVFYAVMFKMTAVGLPHPDEIDDDSASYLQSVAEKAAVDIK